ncbi:V-set and immunoglobulin domain-containing protein 8b [Genypterus blacodes]|uniref:V-set and immunoglobulin domain-containing protein 8b n=1 Tax=Genypterus blacodes TaxID=154954 RepID=UPI003F75CA1D
MECVFTGGRLKVAVLFLLTIQLKTDVTEAMQVTSDGPQTIKRAQGEKVTLGCTYSPGAEDNGELDIEWLNVSPDMTQKDKLLLSYAGGKTIHYGDAGLSNRLNFITNPNLGDASISISDIRLLDTATYQCKVKKMPGVDMRKVTLVVMHRPSVPKCWVEGSEEKNGPVSLRCNSHQGSTPLTYTWRRESGGSIPPPPTAIQDPQTGELLIRNHSDSYVGNYVCEVQNAVGKAQCKYTLHAYNPPNKAGIIAGAVIGALLLLLLLLLLIWLLICCCNKRRYQKEMHNEIIDDPIPTPAPTSRSNSRQSSRQSSLRSVPGYITHHSVTYNPVKAVLPSVSESGYNASPNAPRLKYDQQYGYPV